MARGRRNANESPMSLFSFQDIITSVSGIMIFIVLLLSLEITAPPAQEPEIEDKGRVVPEDLRELAAGREAKRESLRILREKLRAETTRIDEMKAIDWVALDKRIDAQTLLLADLRERSGASQDTLAKVSQKNRKCPPCEKTLRARIAQHLAAREKLASDVERLDQKVKQHRLELIPEKQTGKRAVFIQISATDFLVKAIDTAGDPKRFTVDTAGLNQLERYVKTRSKKLDSFVLLVKPSGFPHMEVARTVVEKNGFSIGWEPLEEHMSGVY